MRSSELAEKLIQQGLRVGDLTVLIQGDAEGNGFEDVRGVGWAWLEPDEGTVFDSLSDAEEYGYDEADLRKVIVIYP